MGDGGWINAVTNGDIQYLSLITPHNKYSVNLKNGQICGEDLYREDKLKLTCKNVFYQPIQYKVGFFYDHFGQGVSSYNIGWLADYGEFKIKTILSIDGKTFQPSIFVQEVN